MKKMKLIIGSTAFLVAVAAAIASTNVPTENLADQYYRINGSGQCVETNCDPLHTGTLCEFTVYETKLSQSQCDNPVIESRRP